MIVTGGMAVDHIQHVIVPHVDGGYMTGVRVHASLPPGSPPGWIVLPFPNKDKQWDVMETKEPAAIEALYEVGMLASVEPCDWKRARRVVVAPDFAALIRDIRWDIMPNTTSNFDTDMARIRRTYSDYGFVALEIPCTGGYKVSWRWYGDRPFAATAWLDKDRAPETQVIKMRDVCGVEWVTPGPSDPAPTPVLIQENGIETEARSTGRNSDIIGISKRPSNAHPASCRIM